MKVAKPPKQIHFPQMETQILAKWEAEDTFQKSLNHRKEAPPFHFYDGPPFATGLPHFGHFVPSSIKDAFPRYFTMKGYHVARRFGWDCHGVPVEMLVQKELGLKGRADIESFGIAQFNQACRESVLRYTGQWRQYMKKLGRWVDMENEYRTMDTPFMESVWAVIQKLWNQNLIYEGLKVVSYSTALGSALSNFEASLDYRDVQDPSVTLKARIVEGGKWEGASLLVWTTTPWTLPVNVAVAVDPEGTYARVKPSDSAETLILLQSRLPDFFNPAQIQVLETFKGQELEGLKYQPWFNCFSEKWNGACHRIYGTSYVLHDTGTGAVHTAPCFGEDDFGCAQAHGLPYIDHIDVNGNLLPGNPTGTEGLYFKDSDKPLMGLLKKTNVVFKHDTIVHSYPMCYRSGTPLMYRAQPGWFVNVLSIKAKLQENNLKINWVPDHIKEGRFGRWLENARDWNISRSRFWGNPIPIWQNAEGERICLGSLKELQRYSSQPITDLHMEHIDHITIPSPTGKSDLKRVPFVLDCWFESGSMPYAQNHYPFEHAEDFLSLFPADFICEGLDQTRGWFYSLNVLSTALFGTPAFKNCVVNGLVLAEDGRKMSKSLKNFPDPMETIDAYGSDSIRLFLLNSPATTADEVRFSVEGVKENTRRILLPLWNAYSFFSTYASLEGFCPEEHAQRFPQKSSHDMDQWVGMRFQKLVAEVDETMGRYHIAKAVPALADFLDDLNNWYIRRSRRRFWEGDVHAFSTLFDVLVGVCKVIAPFAPFAAEFFYQELSYTHAMKKTGSVHLESWPQVREITPLESHMDARVALTRRVVELGRQVRTQNKLKIRQPLASITVGLLDVEQKKALESMSQVIAEELNVKQVYFSLQPDSLAKIFVKPNFKALGKSLGDRIKELQQALQSLDASTSLAALKGDAITVAGIPLDASQYQVELRPSGSQLVAADSQMVVSLDPVITDSLKWEGLARELVSHIQKCRKSGDFQVEDRLFVHVEVTGPLNQALQANLSYVEDETLCQFQPHPPTHAYQQEVDLEGDKVTVTLWSRN